MRTTNSRAPFHRLNKNQLGALANMGIQDEINHLADSIYDQAITWIACNAEPEILNSIEMEDLISVLLVADLFNFPPQKVAYDVAQSRRADL